MGRVYHNTPCRMPEEVKITTEGIITALSKLKFTDKNFPKAVAEYIWNGFDARASIVELDYEFSAGGLRRLVIRDNGHGIPHDQLNLKFQPIFESDKLKDDGNNRNTSQYHGKNGLGRLTFVTFARRARWETAYQQGEKTYSYSIEILGNKLELFSGLDENPEESNKQPSTVVTFSDFKEYNHNKYGKNVGETELLEYLKREFCWFLELNKYKGYKLIINGVKLDYSPLIGDEENFTLTGKRQGEMFSIRYVRWKIPLNQEYSKYYYLDHNCNELHKEYTTLNKKGDRFYHSVFIASKYFRNFKFDSTEDQENITGFGRSDETFKQLTEQLQGYLRRKRKPFLRQHAKKVIADFEREGIIAKKDADSFQLIQIEDLEEVIQEIYTTQPRIFLDLSQEQQKMLISLLNVVLNSEDRDEILKIIEDIVELDADERGELAELLKVTEMQKIVKTIKLIADRQMVLKLIEECLFNDSFGANEVDHIQKIVESNTWLFGEQYALVAAAEDTFEKALRNQIRILSAKDEKVHIDNPDKNKQVDIFICRQNKHHKGVHNVIIELKHPKKRIGLEQLNQVKTYLSVVLSEPRFNGDSFSWEFILVGTKYDSRGLIEREIKSYEGKGERGIVQDLENCKIYIRKWSDILSDCEIRHSFVNNQLEIQKNRLIEKTKTASEAVKQANASSAAM
ncbi:hypothetical protein F8E02_07930 [Methanoculleus sp. Wushi-C6]|uniref:Histidine kinase/DNA gyrase B/HSP90-like ATPase n=2 Tax=Methanoculleus caldifontis TaxID=2651577 RepID=A0ABU3X1K0_9EURY|nr:hypothetical protein [Methanoculleus sp. Wushi-C6]